MKLKNKKTGKTGKLSFAPDKEYHFTTVTLDGEDILIYKTLAELNEDWEDYEEPKEYWYIDNLNVEGVEEEYWEASPKQRFNKEIGNHFETKEEAEEAVEKLKAWKRLKDKGYRFNGWRSPDGVDLEFPNSESHPEDCDDLVLLFGGDE